MNTLVNDWVNNENLKARENRVMGRHSNQAIIEVSSDFHDILDSRLFPIARSSFTTRLRQRR